VWAGEREAVGSGGQGEPSEDEGGGGGKGEEDISELLDALDERRSFFIMRI
jgi:hypothetical protein